MKLNSGLLGLEDEYVFAEVRRRVQRYTAQNPEKKTISLGIGDVSGPLCRAVTRAMQRAVREQGRRRSFHGYGPEQGYPFLRQQIAAALTAGGASVQPREVFVSDGAKTDLGGLLDLLEPGSRVLLCDPTYPAVLDDCRIRGSNRWRFRREKAMIFSPCRRRESRIWMPYTSAARPTQPVPFTTAPRWLRGFIMPAQTNCFCSLMRPMRLLSATPRCPAASMRFPVPSTVRWKSAPFPSWRGLPGPGAAMQFSLMN